MHKNVPKLAVYLVASSVGVSGALFVTSILMDACGCAKPRHKTPAGPAKASRPAAESLQIEFVDVELGAPYQPSKVWNSSVRLGLGS